MVPANGSWCNNFQISVMGLLIPYSGSLLWNSPILHARIVWCDLAFSVGRVAAYIRLTWGPKGPSHLNREINMATIIINTEVSPRLGSDVLSVFLSVMVVLCFWWVVRCWFSFWGSRARNEIAAFDSCEDNLADLIVQGRVEDGVDVSAVLDKDFRIRFRSCRMQRMACALANSAYLQFGYRPQSEANKMVTRKFMRDELSKFPDLRVKDSLTIIDRALVLSFLPSEMFKEMRCVESTGVFGRRAQVGSWWGWKQFFVNAFISPRT